MNRTKKICSECGRTEYIFSKGRCQRCAALAYKKTSDERKAASGKPKKSTLNQRRKPTGERELFEEIWNERPHECENCGRGLGSVAIANYFSHHKPKGKYPEFRLDKSNIDLLCMDCHYCWEHDKRKFYSRSLPESKFYKGDENSN